MFCREAAGGSPVNKGLKKCLVNVVDLRCNSQDTEATSSQQFANTIGITVILPPEMPTDLVDSPTGWVDASTECKPETEASRSEAGAGHFKGRYGLLRGLKPC